MYLREKVHLNEFYMSFNNKFRIPLGSIGKCSNVGLNILIELLLYKHKEEGYG